MIIRTLRILAMTIAIRLLLAGLVIITLVQAVAIRNRKG